jgi:UDP-N-acetylmuramyl tripeptide synthase
MRLALESSRRLTGPNLIASGPGAVLDVRIDATDSARLAAAWERRAREILEGVGWARERTCARFHRDGVSLALSAPVDALYAATEVNEWALDAATADLEGRTNEEASEAAARLAARIEAESNPALLRLRDAAAERGVMFLSDDDRASVGMGSGSLTWSVDEPPAPGDVDWAEIHDVPLVMVTGTNGKTTTVRLLAAMIGASGRTAGFSSTDGVFVGDQPAESGDYSGPGGARAVLRDTRVEAAVLETARGGMLRRGLGAPRADGVAVTNVGADHLGEYGLHDIEDVAAAKLVVARAVEAGGRLVLNADDPVLARRWPHGAATLVWTSRHPDVPPAARRTRHSGGFLASHLEAGGEAVVVEDGAFVRRCGPDRRRLLAVEEAPVTLAGAAAYNVENVLIALALAPALGVSDGAAADALVAFRPTADHLPGRTNLFRFGDAAVLVDFAHNPHGMDALAETVLRLPARRRLVVIGQAGDRDDASIRALVRSALHMRPDRVVVKELTRYLRGREPGEVPGLIQDELLAVAPDVEVVVAADELVAARSALEWCAEGDLLVLPVHARRDEVIGWLTALERSGWRPGTPLPGPPPAQV